MAARKKAAPKRGKRNGSEKRKTRPSDGGRPLLDESEFEKFFEYLECGFSVSQASTATGIAIATIRRHEERFPEFRAKLQNAKDLPMLTAGRGLVRLMEAGEFPAIKLFLERRSEDYKPQVEVDHNFPTEVAKALVAMGATEDGYE